MPKQSFEELLSAVGKEGASDLHISAGRRPTLRIDGNLVPLTQYEVLTPDTAREFVFALLNDAQEEQFVKELELDFSYNFRDRARFRVNVFHQRGFMSAALRLISTKIRTL